MKDNFKKFLFIILIIVCFGGVLVCLYLSLHITNKNLAETHYSLTTELSDSLRIVQLTDLHNAEFGKGNSELVELVDKQNPDLIVMTGDMLNRDDDNPDIVVNLIKDLVKIAPVYYGYGNHEYTWMENYNSGLKPILETAGAVAVNNDYYDITINGNELRIGGYMGYYTKAGMLTTDPNRLAIEDAFPDEFENTNSYKILLNHIPTGWLDWGYMNTRSVDLVFSGHYHGGQWVLPVIGAVYAPYVGFNPPYTKGVFVGTSATCILSAGLGNEYTYVPRVNNPPEVVVVDLIPEN